MKKLYTLLLVTSIFISTNIQAQVTFKNQNVKLTNGTMKSGNCVAIVDWNFDGLDDIIRLDDGRICYVDVQRTNNQFQTVYLGTFSSSAGWAWGMAVADLDHNGFMDVAAGAYGPAVRILMTDNSGASATLVSIPNSSYFVQNMTFADFNNDGWIDLFVCDDNAMSHIYLNGGTGTLTESGTTINFDVTGTDDSGNYGSVWTDFDNDGDLDLYIAKCKQGVTNPADGRRINVMFVNDGNNNFTENAAAYNINIGWQTWTASFGDIDNDGDLDLLVTNHDHASQILENDGTGHYTDITANSGFNVSDITPVESIMEDFDNDGFVDLLITGSSNRYFHNNGNKTFTKIEGLFNTNDMLSFATGDLNHDGLIDLYTSYGDAYNNPSNIDDVLWMNSTRNNNHFITLNLLGTISNKGAIGARALIYGAWGIQIREVRAGDNYGTTNSAMLHFGLGTSTTIDSIVVKFPSGITTTLINPVVDQFMTIIENDCVSPVASVTYSQTENVICTGSTETLTASTGGLSYLWNDGSTGQTLNITAGGEYNVEVSAAGNNCKSISPTLIIEQDPDQTPVITATGETEFCNGSSVTLQSQTYGVSSFTWSNGDFTPFTSITQTGVYTLTIQGFCAQFTSTPISVTVHVVPDPSTNNVTIQGPGSATLNATGTVINWYDSLNAVTPIFTGPTFTTPVLTAQTNYWVDNSETFNAGIFNTGLFVPSGNTQFSANTTNARMFFDVIKPCTLKTAKVYTDTPGLRRIELRNSADSLLQFIDVTIAPDSQLVTFDFVLTPGTDYYLTTDAAINQAIPGWGNPSPRLKRNSVGVSYPYTVTDAVSFTGNNFGGQYYYYFYDISVEKTGLTCTSNKVQVTVDISTAGLQNIETSGIQLFPNPANEMLNIHLDQPGQLLVNIYDATGRRVSNSTFNTLQNVLSLSGLTAGVYTVELIKTGNRYQHKLIKY